MFNFVVCHWCELKTDFLMNKSLLLSVIFGSVILTNCGTTKQEKEANTSEQTVVDPANEQLEKLKAEASRLRAGGSIKTVTLEQGVATVEYVKDYNEYRELNPQSSLTKSDLESYWESGDAIEKALVDGSVRLLRKMDFLEETNITLPYKGTTYSISVNKADLEKFIGVDLTQILANWDELFSNPYVYSDDGRSKFFNKFGSKN